MAIELTIASGMSIADIQKAQHAGMSAVRTDHVGNNRGYNDAIAAAGIPMQGVDHTIVAQFPGDAGDNNYLPGSIVTHNRTKPLDINRVGGLTMQTTATDPATGERVYLDQLHTRSLRAAFPDTPIVTNTEYISAAENISSEVIRLALATAPELFGRVVESDGTIRKPAFGSFAGLAQSYGILQLNDDPHTSRGVLVPNEVSIVLGFVVEALRRGDDTQLHLSGPDFAGYSQEPDFQARLNRLYETVRQQASFGQQLPETLHVKIIPAAAARFVAPLGQEEPLRQIFEILAQSAALEDEKRAFFAAHPGRSAESVQFLAETKSRQYEINLALGQLAVQADYLFIGPRDAPFPSQYDVLEAGGLYVAEANMRLTMHELDVLFRRLERAREQALNGQAT